jgi:galactokinase
LQQKFAEAYSGFVKHFSHPPEAFITSPGRTEIGGNHTDHQHGRVLAGAVALDITCAAAKNCSGIVRLFSEGYPPITIDLTCLEEQPAERGSSCALIRGEGAFLSKKGYSISGFDAYMYSRVPPGSGLSSSAAFENAIGYILKGLYAPDISPLEIALAGQFAENVFFGKPSGLMDQTASSFGGLTLIDFENPEAPRITALNASFEGYSLCIVCTGGNHATLTGDYAAIPAEMKSIAHFFGKRFLREVSPFDFYAALPQLRTLGDRAVLRAMHFFDENERAFLEAMALKENRFDDFLTLVNESGNSSYFMLQNIYSGSEPSAQGISLALALAKKALSGRGACRVHGGGFAGTIQCFVPDHMRESFTQQLEAVFGAESVIRTSINPHGGQIFYV